MRPQPKAPAVVGHLGMADEQQRVHVGDWVVTVLCPYCGRPHTHAAPKGPHEDPGFRIAHCRLDRQGYQVVWADPEGGGNAPGVNAPNLDVGGAGPPSGSDPAGSEPGLGPHHENHEATS